MNEGVEKYVKDTSESLVSLAKESAVNSEKLVQLEKGQTELKADFKSMSSRLVRIETLIWGFGALLIFGSKIVELFQKLS